MAVSTEFIRSDYSQDTHDTLAEVADRLHGMDWQQLRDELRIPEAARFESETAHPVDVLDIKPESGETEHTVALFSPMANGLFPHIQLRAGVLAATMPDTRVVAFGNPSLGRYNAGNVDRNGRADIVRNGNLRPLINAPMEYLKSEGVESLSLFGYSAGADLAATATAYADAYDVAVSRVGVAEPASIARRGLAKVGLAFGSTAKHFRDYMNASDMPGLVEAFEKHAVKGAKYNASLVKLTNLALARDLGTNNFGMRAFDALVEQPDVVMTLSWGSESELATDATMKAIATGLRPGFGERVRALRLPGRHHAMADNIYLHTAIAMDAVAANSDN